MMKEGGKMKTVSLCLVGFGNVGRAFVRLIQTKQEKLARQFDLNLRVTGIATGRHGMAICPDGINLDQALAFVEAGKSLSELSSVPSPDSVIEFIRACPANIMLENTPVNHHTGQPAIDHLRTALECGMHAITANKGPVVHAYQELTHLAESLSLRFLFESAVMDGAPIFSLFRGSLPAIELKGFQGILNSCTNFIIGLMEQNKTFEQAVIEAQAIGIAETDPSADIDGWDAAIKVAALSTVLMGIQHLPQQVSRSGIRSITREQITQAASQGKRWKLVCSARREGGQIISSVSPQMVSAGSPLFSINGTSSYVQFETDVLPGLGIVESNPGPETTAYGLLADLLNALRGM
jgi:homoserine dehydrogenase